MLKNKSIKTLVLSSKENFVWVSMQEIIPSLEEAWISSGQQSPPQHSVKVFHVEEVSLATVIKEAIQAENIVFTCFTHKLSQLAKLIRQKVGVDARYIIHLHSLATIGLWPIYKWGMGDVLKKSDIFISTCERDKTCLELSLPLPHCHVIPFSLLELNQKDAIPMTQRSDGILPLYYIGRLSAQKNLHTLLFSLYLLLQKKGNLPPFKLFLFGGEDNLGSPNMELYRHGLKQYLEELIVQLQLTSHVELMGFVERGELERNYMHIPHLLVSSSLHSDENFGIAALRSLAKGHHALLSDWGGHTDYATHFPDQVSLIPVYHSSRGPVINPFEMANLLGLAINNFSYDPKHGLPYYYQVESISERYRQLALSPRDSSEELRPKEIVKEMLSRHEFYLQHNLKHPEDLPERRIGCKVFENYEDQLSHRFLASYGMENQISFSPNMSKALIPPWVNISSSTISISDFHRGDYTMDYQQGELQLVDIYQKSYSVSQDIFDYLIKTGMAFIPGP